MTDLKNDLRTQRIQTEEKLNTLNEGLLSLEMYKETVTNVKTRCNELSSNFNSMSTRFNQYEAEKVAYQEQLQSIQTRLDRQEASINTLNNRNENSESSNKYTHLMEVEHRNLNVLLSCLPPEFHSVEGLCGFSRSYLRHDIGDNELTEVFKVGDANRGVIVKARFATLDARTWFYKARTCLGANSDIWMNDDLTRQQEVLAHEARQLYQGGKIFRTWTYLNSVFVQRLPTYLPLKVTDSRTLNAGAADSMGNITQLFTLVPSRNRTYLPGKNPNIMYTQNPLRQQTQGPYVQGMSNITDAQPQMRRQSNFQRVQGIPGGQYQPLIPLNTMEEGYRNRQCSGKFNPMSPIC